MLPHVTGKMRKVGAASVPNRAAMRVSTSWPGGLLEVSGPRILVRLRWVGRVLGALDLSASVPSELREVYLVEALPISGMGLGFRDLQDRDWYFWPMGGDTFARQMLEAIRGCGYSVDDVPRKAKKRWQGVA